MNDELNAESEDIGNPELSPNEQLEQQIVALLENGKKIEAVKLLRENLGSGLKDAKDAVEAIGRKHGIESPSGCAGMLLLAIGFSALLASQLV